MKSSGLRKKKARCKNSKSASFWCYMLLSEPARMERCKSKRSNEILVLDDSRDKLFPRC